MSAPSKPWEGPSHRHMSNGYIDDLAYPQRPGGMAAPPVPGQPPPLPPRRRVLPSSSLGATAGLYNGYGAGYSGGGYSGGYGSSYMSPFGSNLYGSSPYGMTFSPYNRTPFDSRDGYGGEDGQSPFQSVESVVRAMSSLSMMMESTYQSMFMSFRAVMGVAENMERLRRVVLDLFGGIAIVKSVLWFFKKILYVMGLIKNNPSRERLWEAAAAQVVSGATSGPPEQRRRTWPLVAFFGLMLGGPYVLYKLIQPEDRPQEWDPRKDGVQCVAVYEFDTNQRGELPFRRGEVLVRQRSAQGGWALAVKKNGQTGYVPSDRLKPISAMPRKTVPKQSSAHYSRPTQSAEDAVNHPQPGPAHMGSLNHGLPPQNNHYVRVPSHIPLVQTPVPIVDASNPLVGTCNPIVDASDPLVDTCKPIVEPIDDVIEAPDSTVVIDTTIPVLSEPSPQGAPQDPVDPTNQS